MYCVAFLHVSEQFYAVHDILNGSYMRIY